MSHRILVVDHDQDNVRRTLRAFADAGFEIDVAGSVGQTLVLLDKRPELVLIEATLQDTPGWEVCRQVKDSEEGSGLPVVILHPPEADADLMAALAQSGCDQLVDHSISPEDLVALCRDRLEPPEEAAAETPDEESQKTPPVRKRRKRSGRSRKVKTAAATKKAGDEKPAEPTSEPIAAGVASEPVQARAGIDSGETELTGEEVGDAMGRLGRIISDQPVSEETAASKETHGDFSHVEAELRRTDAEAPRRRHEPRIGPSTGAASSQEGGDIDDHLDKLFSGEADTTPGTGHSPTPSVPVRSPGPPTGEAGPVRARSPIPPPDPRTIDQPARELPVGAEAAPEAKPGTDRVEALRPHRDRTGGAITGPIAPPIGDQTSPADPIPLSEAAPPADRRAPMARMGQTGNTARPDQTARISAARARADAAGPAVVAPGPTAGAPSATSATGSVPRRALQKTPALPPRVARKSRRLGLIAAGVAILSISAAVVVFLPRSKTPPQPPSPEASRAADSRSGPESQTPARAARTNVAWPAPPEASSVGAPAEIVEAPKPSVPPVTETAEAKVPIAVTGGAIATPDPEPAAATLPAPPKPAPEVTVETAAAQPRAPEPELAPAAEPPAPLVTAVVDDSPSPVATHEPEPLREAPIEPPAGETAPDDSSPVEVASPAADLPVVTPAPEPVAPEFTEPAVIERVEAVYPAKAKKRGERGTIVLNVLVNEQGRIVRVVVEQGLNGSELEAAAMSAVLRWKFEPARENGAPVRAWAKARFTFDPTSP